MSEKIAVLCHTWDGLGDNLNHTTIPEILYKHGFKVYISTQQKYRNPDIKRLIDLNPYLAGYSDLPVTINIDQIFCSGHYPASHPNKSYHARIEYTLFGKVYNNHPVIYYKPKYLPEWADKTAVDFKSHSHPHETDRFLAHAHKYNNNIVRLQVDHVTKDIFEYIDIIASCKKFICTYSGSNVLASAINKYNVECYLEEGWIEVALKQKGLPYHYTNVNYINVDNPGNSLINY